MSKMIIMSGLPGSGKSSKAKELLKSGNVVRINKDLLRTMLHFDNFTGKNEEKTRIAARTLATYFLTTGVDVIIDDTNLNPGTKQSWKDLAKDLGCKIEYQHMDTPIEVCLERDFNRIKQVGPTVIKKMALEYQDYMKGERVVVCDLDGTLCNIEHRLKYARGEEKNWDTFFSLIPNDTVREDVVLTVGELLSTDPNMKLILVSARPETYRSETMAWLTENLRGSILKDRFEVLIMRNSNDKRVDTEVKSEIYDKYLKNLHIVAVVDDRPSVIRMWEEKGLSVINVGNNIEF